ncbi:MAG: hypothetical protein KC619_24980 [Myxococcales bacterium]|nr:hypothetical protein [Myxococcales bacterium]
MSSSRTSAAEPSPEAPPETSPETTAAPAPLITAEDVRRELYRLFGTGDAGEELVVSIYGGEQDGDAVAAYEELMRSLAMHAEGQVAGGLPDARVATPDAKTIERALLVLARRDLQRELLDHILTTFGGHLIDPLTELLDTGPDGAIRAQLELVRARVLDDIRDLGVTHETRAILIGDLEKLLGADYLSMLAEHEEQVQRPRVRRMAREILRVIGNAFHAALARWPGHASAIARAARRRVGDEVPLRELPVLIRTQVVSGVEEFLWVETSNDIQGALTSMFAAQRGILAEAPALEREAYRAFAERCWQLITSRM